MTPVIAAILGLAWGFVADRISARWPAHEDGSIRRIDWRTIVVIVAAGAALWATEARFGGRPRRARS